MGEVVQLGVVVEHKVTIKPMKVGIFGGTFDPLHYGHLILAQEAYEQYELDAVVFVPTMHTTYRGVIADYTTRCNMLRNVLDLDSRFTIRQYDHTYTVEVLAALRFDDIFDCAEYSLIVGGDQAGSFFTWRDPEHILEVANVICAERSSYDRGRIQDHWGEHGDKLNWLEMTAVDLSASDIRQRVSEGRSIQYLVPPAVEEYIHSEGLYRG
jgi:nicotinate-nucleotide adenylyltransferase